MRLGGWVLAAAMSVAVTVPALAAVTRDEFPPKSVRQLIEICSASKGDPMMTAAVNFCQGYVEGAIDVEEADTARFHRRPLFCLPSPPPSHDEALAAFTSWAGADPERMDRPALDGVFAYLAETYPCARPAMKRRK
ncbi:MAG TPA: Rap1a/Tai family immunity protein [Acetobacteraceae bacterium]|nr:Rap1a/Tai family immunity protein [Acetobacteraceae bacterium]